MLDEEHSVEIGDIVKWWTRYADDIIRDAGAGLVLNIKSFEYHSLVGDKSIEYKNFDIYRFKFNDIMCISQRDIEILKE